jgi:DNA-binding NarL/FixJ family response regulator
VIRLVIVDNEPLTRIGLRSALAPVDDIDVTDAVGVQDAVATVQREEPHVVLLDSCTRDAPMLSAGLGSMKSPPHVCVLSRFPDEEYVAVALAAGARGYVLKSTPAEQLAPLVRFVAAGWTMTSPMISNSLKGRFLNGLDQDAVKEELTSLTARERHVLALLAEGLSNPEIALATHLSPATVKDHVSAILHKLNVQRRIHAALLAHRAGLTREPHHQGP